VTRSMSVAIRAVMAFTVSESGYNMRRSWIAVSSHFVTVAQPLPHGR
jgi:hypothetical protein